MADVTPKTEGHKGARKHTGLGRGLGALIPQAGEQKPPTPPALPARPLDVFSPKALPPAVGEDPQRISSSLSAPRPRRTRKRHAMPTPGHWRGTPHGECI